jgi:hypothetical protein
MLLTVLLEDQRVLVEVEFDEDDDGLHIEYTTCKEHFKSLAWAIFNDASNREIETAVWAAHVEAQFESKAP